MNLISVNLCFNHKYPNTKLTFLGLVRKAGLNGKPLGNSRTVNYLGKAGCTFDVRPQADSRASYLTTLNMFSSPGSKTPWVRKRRMI